MKALTFRIVERALALALLSALGTNALAVDPSQVQPPREPQMSKDPDEDSPRLAQPVLLTAELMALTEGRNDERVERLKRKVLKDLVYVEGGSFMMGDIGPMWSPEELYYTPRLDNKPPYKVTLTSYSIAKYKTTYAEYDVFADATGRPRAGMEVRPGWEILPQGLFRHPLVPAGMYWQEAQDYCQWLGTQIGVPFSLPTEAQWEYAARSRGQNFIWATDNGHMDKGRNMASGRQKGTLPPVVKTDPYDLAGINKTMLFPVGVFPPNPLGLYDMNANGWEWMQDWYDEDWYQVSPEDDPKGPPTGTVQSIRGYASGDYVSGLNFMRTGRDPQVTGKDILTDIVGPGLNVSHSVRCAVNLNRPVSPLP